MDLLYVENILPQATDKAELRTVYTVLLRVISTMPYKIIGKQKVLIKDINKWGEVLFPLYLAIHLMLRKNFVLRVVCFFKFISR